MQAMNWLLRSVTQPVCLHDLLWWFVTSLTPAESDADPEDDAKLLKKTDEQVGDCIVSQYLRYIFINYALTFIGPERFRAPSFRREHRWRCRLSFAEHIPRFASNNSRFNDFIAYGLCTAADSSQVLGNTLQFQ